MQRFLKNAYTVVYNLIYPAILGSMMYDVSNNIDWANLGSYFVTYKPHRIIKISILLFYLFDYYHLYAFMDKEYTKEQKTKKIYMSLDISVSLLLLSAFKIYEAFPRIAILFISLVSLCFLGYNIQLMLTRNEGQPKTLWFYFPYCLGFIMVNFVCLEMAPWAILIMVLTYVVYVLTRKNSEERESIILLSDEGNKYTSPVIGGLEDIFEKIREKTNSGPSTRRSFKTSIQIILKSFYSL